MAIFTHVTVGTNDLAKARAFYDNVLAPLGLVFDTTGTPWSVTSAELPPAFSRLAGFGRLFLYVPSNRYRGVIDGAVLSNSLVTTPR